MDWTHAAAVALAAFLAALVEFVEALTIVLAVGSVSGWRPALGGSAAGLLLLAVLVALLGPALDSIPLAPLQAVIGILLLLFGTRWLRKAILRGAGLMALHDEAAIFSAETASLRRAIGSAIAWTTAFKAVVLEGAEVIFLVLALGAAGEALAAATAGAAVALAMVVLLGLMLHRPLAQVPENALKFAVGVMASAYGLFWIGEALGFAWPGGDAALIGLIAAWAGLALALVQLLKLPKEAGA
jgi:Ca2+/H+ antiporter, TMEM165/GDT1 family